MLTLAIPDFRKIRKAREYVLGILTSNCKGMRTRRKRIHSGQALYKLKVGLCVVVETLLRKDEVGKLPSQGYEVEADTCRGEVARIGRGWPGYDVENGL